MTAPTPNAPTAALSTDDAIARRIAVRAVQSLADSLPDEDTIEAQDRLKGTPQESFFVVSAETLEELITVAISNAMYDGELAARQSPPMQDFRGYFAGINAADGMSTPAAEREGAASPRCVFCGKRKELREMDGVWLCPGPHEAIALDQLAALRNARDYWQGEAKAATAALLAARRGERALRDALEEVEETLNHPDLSDRSDAKCDEIAKTVAAALAATREPR